MSKGPLPVFVSKTIDNWYTVGVVTDTTTVALIAFMFASPIFFLADWRLDIFGPPGLILGVIGLLLTGWLVSRTWLGGIVGQFCFTFIAGLLIPLLPLVPLSLAQAATPLSIEIRQLGDGTTTSSFTTSVIIRVSGGDSDRHQSCQSFFTTFTQYRIQVSTPTRKSRGSEKIFGGRTLATTASYLDCQFSVSPEWLLDQAWDVPEDSVPLTVSIYAADKLMSSKVVTMVDVNRGPQIKITSPTRGSSFDGSFSVKFDTINASRWTLSSFFVNIIQGSTDNCNANGGGDLIKVGTAIVTNTDGSYSTKAFVERQSDNALNIRLLTSGPHLICLKGIFSLSSETEVSKSAEASVAITSTALKTLEMRYDDPLLKSLYYRYLIPAMICPSKVNESVSTYSCTLSVGVDPKFIYGEFPLYISSATKVSITGRVPFNLCIGHSEDKYYMSCSASNSSSFDTISEVLVPVGGSLRIAVKNFLPSYGFTEIRVSGVSFSTSYKYSSQNYESRKVRARNAPPSSRLQKSIATSVKNSMISSCLRDPKDLGSYSFKFIKKTTSFNGMPGYVFKLGPKLLLQINDYNGMYNFFPSSAKVDQDIWKSWGCGTRSLWAP